MRKNIIPLVVIAFLICSVGLLVACGGGGTSEQSVETEESTFDGQALLDDRCEGCHSLSYVTETSKTESGWAQTVNRMIGYGADLDSAERDALVAYLTQEYGQ